jgi:hypothetical protein
MAGEIARDFILAWRFTTPTHARSACVRDPGFAPGRAYLRGPVGNAFFHSKAEIVNGFVRITEKAFRLHNFWMTLPEPLFNIAA